MRLVSLLDQTLLTQAWCGPAGSFGTVFRPVGADLFFASGFLIKINILTMNVIVDIAIYGHCIKQIIPASTPNKST